MTMVCPIVELREGGEVRAAAVLPDSDSRLRLVFGDGREMRVPRSRIVHDTGETVSASRPETVAAALKAWEDSAERRSLDVDVKALHELLAAENSSAPLGLADLAALALGDETGSSRAAVHRALAAATAWFRFSGDAWTPRPADEVEAELAKRRHAEQLERERADFVAAARARLRGATDSLPPGSAKFLRALRDVALNGDQSRMKKEAGALADELEARTGGAGLSDEHAFEILVALGEMARDENLALLRAGVPLDFPPEIVAAAEEAGRRPIGERTDFRSLEIVTIDDESTTEIDDGVSLQRTPRGLRIGIHVADAAHFVDLGTALDLDAEARATSYYLPDCVIKMLPPVLAEGPASLVAGVDRAALSFLVEVTPHGEVLDFTVAESVVRVSERMTYEDCEAALEGRRGPSWMKDLAGLAKELEAQRLEAGATPIRAHEIAIHFGDDGEPVVTLVDPGRPARVLVAELMVLANRLLAQWCRDRGLPAIYRKQAKPSGAAPPPPRDRVDPLAAFEFRKTLQRTEVSLEPGPHAGLGVECYLQATSPIRRYQDLAQHRIVKAALAGRPLPYSREQLQAIASSTEAAGRQARQIETETDRYYILRVLERRIGDVIEAVVVRSEPRQTLVELVDFALVTPLAHRPDHARGQRILVRVRASKPRRGALVLEHVGPAEAP